MSEILIKYSLGEEEFLVKRVSYSLHFNQDDTNIKSDFFPKRLILGNFTNALLWKTILSTPEHFHGFEKLIPLSRIKISKELLYELQKNYVKKIELNEEPELRVRKFSYQNIFKYLLNIDEIDLVSLSKSLKLSPFSILDSDVNGELFLLGEDLQIISKSYQSIWESQMEYFNSSPLRFLPKSLMVDGLDLFDGFFYENSGYNSHLVYIPKVQASFVFCGDLSFAEIWLLVVQTLSEIDCFRNQDYLDKLMQIVCPYPWVSVEVISDD
ncbi:MAG: hypothetical protein KC646_16420 [Candidatus Cloacimonetes bacterium]|nr:hypothetical protein [Candidatus Cloacimonadota bacterium]